jgi:hypothetical protein
MPDYPSSNVAKLEEKMGEFVYKNDENYDSVNLIEKGPFMLDNQTAYKGQWSKAGLRQGRGLQIWPDGSKYIGYWNEDKADKYGRLIHADGGLYEGAWCDDEAHGLGKYLNIDGSEYQGDWRHDMQHGEGVEKWPDGSFYHGRFENGKKNGKGKF